MLSYGEVPVRFSLIVSLLHNISILAFIYQLTEELAEATRKVKGPEHTISFSRYASERKVASINRFRARALSRLPSSPLSCR